MHTYVDTHTHGYYVKVVVAEVVIVEFGQNHYQ